MKKHNINIVYNKKLDTTIKYSPLKIHFWVIDNTVIMKVLEQDSRLFIDDIIFFAECDNIDNIDVMNFWSVTYPELDSSDIFLQGKEVENNNVTNAIVLVSKAEALNYVNYIKEVFEKVDIMETEILIDVIETEDTK